MGVPSARREEVRLRGHLGWQGARTNSSLFSKPRLGLAVSLADPAAQLASDRLLLCA